MQFPHRLWLSGSPYTSLLSTLTLVLAEGVRVSTVAWATGIPGWSWTRWAMDALDCLPGQRATTQSLRTALRAKHYQDIMEIVHNLNVMAFLANKQQYLGLNASYRNCKVNN